MALLNPVDLTVQLLDELELLVRHLVLLLDLVVLELEAANGNLQQLILTLAVHCTVLVELVLRLLILILFLPDLDLLPELLFGFLELLGLSAQLGDRRFELLNLDVLDLGVLLRGQLLHRSQQLLLFPLDLDVVRCHVFIFVLLEDLVEVLVEAVYLLIQLVLRRQDVLPDLHRLGRAHGPTRLDLPLHKRHR